MITVEKTAVTNKLIGHGREYVQATRQILHRVAAQGVISGNLFRLIKDEDGYSVYHKDGYKVLRECSLIRTAIYFLKLEGDTFAFNLANFYDDIPVYIE